MVLDTACGDLGHLTLTLKLLEAKIVDDGDCLRGCFSAVGNEAG